VGSDAFHRHRMSWRPRNAGQETPKEAVHLPSPLATVTSACWSSSATAAALMMRARAGPGGDRGPRAAEVTHAARSTPTHTTGAVITLYCNSAIDRSLARGTGPPRGRGKNCCTTAARLFPLARGGSCVVDNY
jgi:hypothetical protein